MDSLRLCVSAFIILFLTTTLGAEENWVLTTADFRSEQVGLVGIDDENATVSTAGEPAKKVGLNKLLMIERAEKPSGAAAKFLAMLSGDDRASGQPKAITGENLLWINPTLGQLTLPLRSVLSIVPSKFAATTTAARTEDIVTLVNGDIVRGIISAINEQTVSVQQTGGGTTDVPLDSVTRIVFASTGAAAARVSHGYRVGLADGSAITVASVKLDAAGLSLALPDGSMRLVPLAAVVSIEHINGPVVWLSALTPTDSVQTPFLDLGWPARMDRAVDGGPIRFGERSYARGIGVHAYSRISWPIDPTFRAFRTQYAIASDLPYANVTVRIKLDERVVHERADVRAGQLPPPVIIPLDGEKQLTLEVDYGQGYDVQDRVNWIEPALLRIRPEPATQPAPTP